MISITAFMDDAALSELEATKAKEAAASVSMDEESFRAFYERTSRGLWAYLSRITNDRQLADDLLQEAYYKFFRAKAAYESEAHRRNSLYQIGTNLARDVMRRRRKVEHVPLPETDDMTFSSAGTAADRAQHRTDLARALTCLTPVQREMIWLAYGQGESHAEIAKTLGLKAASVKLMLFRTRRKLADFLRGGQHG